MRRFTLSALFAFSLSMAATFTVVNTASPASAHDAVCFRQSSGGAWIWGSSTGCTAVMDWQLVSSTLYKWDGSNYNYETSTPGGCLLCANAEAVAATPSGAGWRYVEGSHQAYHHNLAVALSGFEFYRN